MNNKVRKHRPWLILLLLSLAAVIIYVALVLSTSSQESGHFLAADPPNVSPEEGLASKQPSNPKSALSEEGVSPPGRAALQGAPSLRVVDGSGIPVFHQYISPISNWRYNKNSKNDKNHA